MVCSVFTIIWILNFFNEVFQSPKKKRKFYVFFFQTNIITIQNILKKVNVKKNLIRWSSRHPNKRIRYAVSFYQPKSKNHLKLLFKKFRKLKISTYEHDDLPIFNRGGMCQEKNSYFFHKKN